MQLFDAGWRSFTNPTFDDQMLAYPYILTTCVPNSIKYLMNTYKEFYYVNLSVF